MKFSTDSTRKNTVTDVANHEKGMADDFLSKLAQAPSSIRHTRLQWVKKFSKRPFCHYCGKSLEFKTATKDHMTPICRGGTDLIDNIVPACMECNQRKSWRTVDEFKGMSERVFNKPRVSRGNTNVKPSNALEETLNEPGLLKKLVHERERVSWAWRNPA